MQTLEDALANNFHNPNFCKAILFVKKCANRISQTNTSISTPPAETVISGLHKRLQDQIHKIDVEYNIQCNLRAKYRQQREILNGKSISPPQAQALTDPEKGMVETEPHKVASNSMLTVWQPQASIQVHTCPVIPRHDVCTPGWTVGARILSFLKPP